ncbi:Transcriptional regulatory protein walR [Aedoeadaptatus ivorii]|uniref:Transcriptional regulatory protein walR n=1 Tax=Aedoeadaptatus ivorii TaxID=54006 RepID=A0A3S5F7S7_9FIRM|nr:response regulator transcription factor [Peptoniphilus ivorii]MDQ0509097.1 DNA-binding response OmpR family regulator [Peptoniphilus ivorii]VEJ34587.1 Transcriptional regulatory protein walR [Peptoniphilus ivorii]
MKTHERTILITDDDAAILDFVESVLREDGFEHISRAKNQQEALDILAREDIHMAILDIILPDGSGFAIIQQIRKSSNMPVLFLSAVSDVDKQYSGFDLGADDYIVKPFRPKDLLLRTKAILHRAYPESEVVALAASTVDFDRATVRNAKGEVPLTAKEYHILHLLYENKNHIVTIDGILSAVWGEDCYGYENTLMAHIRKIRQKIEQDPSNPESLRTYRGLGYKLRVRP